MTRRGLLTFLVIWLMGFGAALAVSSDNRIAIGYLIGMVVLMLPGLAALQDARRDRPLDFGRAITLALCTGLIAAMTFGALGGVAVGFGAMFGAWVAITVIARQAPHPRGSLIATSIFTAINGVGCVVLLASGEVMAMGYHPHGTIPTGPSTEDLAWLAMTALWPVPLIAACLVRPPPTTPVVRVVD